VDSFIVLFYKSLMKGSNKMNCKMNQLLQLAIIFLFYSLSSFAQQIDKSDSINSEVIPNYTELKIIHSNIVDDDYYLYVKLPKNYDETDKIYPVIYLLDGDIAFTMAWSTVRYLQFGKHLPDVIIVGLGYGSLLSSKKETMRERDYTISKLTDREMSGGGENFLKFIKSELIPFVDSEYRTNPEERILNGYSFGGLFTMYAFLNEHKLFNGYIAGSPYLFSDLEFLEKLLSEKSKILKNSKAKLFISYGSLEDEKLYVNPINKIVQSLYNINYKQSNLKMREFEGGSHFTCPSEAMVYGLKYLFE
ncbi:MAG: alpha/beta hydrolase, partial [Melioribacteraceae bacterium]|nr:alpha/beta hydrolase [Melioribacteraceae bacterium]